MKNTTIPAFAFASVLTLAGCSPQPPVAPPAPVSFQPAASIQDVMVSIVDPAADALWEAVSTETTASGVQEHQPRTAQQWQDVRKHAIALQEAGNLLMMEGRAVTHGGKATEDAHVEGVSSPAQVRQALQEGRAGFNASARAMQEAAGEALAAIDARNPARLLDAGSKLDQACERCHSVYWYPNAKQPSAAAWPAPLKKQ